MTKSFAFEVIKVWCSLMWQKHPRLNHAHGVDKYDICRPKTFLFLKKKRKCYVARSTENYFPNISIFRLLYMLYPSSVYSVVKFCHSLAFLTSFCPVLHSCFNFVYFHLLDVSWFFKSHTVKICVFTICSATLERYVLYQIHEQRKN